MQSCEINICQAMIFRFYTVYNKHKMIKFSNQTRKKSQVLSQVPKYFYCRLYAVSKQNIIIKQKFIINSCMNGIGFLKIAVRSLRE